MEAKVSLLVVSFCSLKNMSVRAVLRTQKSFNRKLLDFDISHLTKHKLKIIKLRNISFSNMDFEILKAAMFASKSTMLKGDDVTTEKMPGKMSPGGGNNAKANEWNFYG